VGGPVEEKRAVVRLHELVEENDNAYGD